MSLGNLCLSMKFALHRSQTKNDWAKNGPSLGHIPVCLLSYIQYRTSDSKYPNLSVFLCISSVSPSLKIDPTKFGPSAGNHTAAGIILLQSMSRETGV